MSYSEASARLLWLEAYASTVLTGDAARTVKAIVADVTALAEENEDLRAELDGLRPIATALTLIRRARTDALLTRAGLGPRSDG